MEGEKIETSTQNMDTKLIKGYVDTVFNIWRMGKDAKLNYEDNKKKLDDVNHLLKEFAKLIKDVDSLFSQLNKEYGMGLRFVDPPDINEYIRMIEYRQKALEKTLVPLKNLSKKYDRTLRILQKNGFQIVEFEVKKFNDGMSIKVLGYDSRQGIEEDTIIETVKPTIFFNDKEYLKGEVIVSKKPDDE